MRAAVASDRPCAGGPVREGLLRGFPRSAPEAGLFPGRALPALRDEKSAVTVSCCPQKSNRGRPRLKNWQKRRFGRSAGGIGPVPGGLLWLTCSGSSGAHRAGWRCRALAPGGRALAEKTPGEQGQGCRGGGGERPDRASVLSARALVKKPSERRAWRCYGVGSRALGLWGKVPACPGHPCVKRHHTGSAASRLFPWPAFCPGFSGQPCARLPFAPLACRTCVA